ncbi:MATE family efflux transporter [candidate division KSB1 bacterium]|nr:MATE family efflux transporter [candidate division KSB1 bacterium]
MKNKNSNFSHPEPGHDWHAFPEGAAGLPAVDIEPELTTLPLNRAVFRLAGPAMTSMLLLMIFNLIDIWWVSKLGAAPLAGVSAAAFILWALESAGTLISAGVTAMVARFIGARQPDMANRVAAQGVLIAIAMAILFGAGGILFDRTTFVLMGLQNDVMQAALDYQFYINIGLVNIFGAFTIDAIFRGLGDTKTPMKLISVALVFNILLDPLLIFGVGPFPALGAGGAALATVISHAIPILFGIPILNHRNVKLFSPAIKFSSNLVWRISKIGAPIAFSGIMFSVSYMVLTRYITDYGAHALAALGLGHRIEGLAYFTAVGFSVAAETLVGQNLGAAKPDRAEKAAWISVLHISIILAGVASVFILFPDTIMRLFTNNPQVIEEGKGYLRTIALFEVFLGFEVVLQGAFSGAGNSMPPMVIIVPLTWARIPLAILFSGPLGMQSQGIWLAISLTTGLKGIVLAFWFKRGHWKNKEI